VGVEEGQVEACVEEAVEGYVFTLFCQQNVTCSNYRVLEWAGEQPTNRWASITVKCECEQLVKRNRDVSEIVTIKGFLVCVSIFHQECSAKYFGSVWLQDQICSIKQPLFACSLLTGNCFKSNA